MFFVYFFGYQFIHSDDRIFHIIIFLLEGIEIIRIDGLYLIFGIHIYKGIL